MNKWPLFFLAACSPFFGFEKLDEKYCVRYGSPEAKFQCTEYYSLSCPKCLEFFKNDFQDIKKQYIDTGSVSWTFHPDPADLLTLQAMVCLDCLPAEHKTLFFEAVMDNLEKVRKKGHGGQLMQTTMEVFTKPLPELEEIEFLQKTDAFQDAFTFVTQEDVVKVIPSIEIDGIFYKEFPSSALIDAHIQQKRSS